MFDTLHTPFPAPVSYSDEDLEGEISVLAGRIAAATCRFLELVAELDRREIH